ncbi:UPF0716 family protein affecting phage T7 exclusion [Paenarthrobacter histidinolovorans]|uniref:UPF0716 family protein affecting phage T7 exclusion n=1 Tax=Paenarthrobacter histidinolovorans TaxID=43664 RepID=A0ABW8NCP6_9MICC
MSRRNEWSLRRTREETPVGEELHLQTDRTDDGVLPDVHASPTRDVPDGETRFRRYCLGFIYLMFGLSTTWMTVVNTIQVNGQLLEHQSSGTQVPGGWIASVVAVIAGFGVLAFAGLFIGIWNLRGLGTMSPAPLVAAIIYSLVSIAMMAVFLSEYGPTLSLVLVHALVIFMTVRMLRQEGVKTLRDLRHGIG